MAHQADQRDRLEAALADRYRIERQIGAGGMATVYLAEDLKHERKVALKVLRPELAAVLGGERFLREIKITAGLNHPHILPLLDSGEADNILYYVMPYVQGDSLRERLNRESQQSIDEALRLTQQVAAALHYAHQHGVMHRDIKPENILLHADEAMVADFGIALALDAAGGARLTETGLSIGTPEYMSPEQASGAKNLDARSDVYALGCVLFEMLVGEPPFTGPSGQAVIARQVLDEPPRMRTVRPSVSEELEGVVQRCLGKAPVDRWKTAEEFRHQLKALSSHTASAVHRSRTGRGMRWRRWKVLTPLLAIGLALIGSTVIIVVQISNNQSAISPAIPRQITFSGTVGHAEISPDGDLLAFVEQGDPDVLRLQDLDGGNVIDVTPIEVSGGALRWSPDGSFLLVQSRTQAFRWITDIYPRLGGNPRPVPRFQSANTIWSPDGSRLATWRTQPYLPNSALTTLEREGISSSELQHTIRLTNLASGDTSSVEIPDSIGSLLVGPGDWSPDGKYIALKTLTSPHTLWTLGVDESGWQQLAQTETAFSAPRWSSSGDAIYYLQWLYGRDDWELTKLHVAGDGRPRGAPEVLAVLQAREISVTADGRTLVYVRGDPRTDIWSVTVAGNSVDSVRHQLNPGTGKANGGDISPDGRSVAYAELRSGTMDLFVVPIDGGPPRRITTNGEVFWYPAPVWSPDGKTIAFASLGAGVGKVNTVRLETGEVRTYEATEMTLGGGVLAWPPGGHIVYRRPGQRGNLQLLDVDTESETPLFADDMQGSETFHSSAILGIHFSPDGQTVAALVGSGRIWLVSLRDHSQRLLTDDPDFNLRGWTADGSAWYVQRGDSIVAVSTTSGDVRYVAKVPTFDNAENVYCSPVDQSQGLTLVCYPYYNSSDVFMIEDFDPDIH